ncbi:hypothetical protein AB0S25_20865, partial [Escherichia coli]
MHPKEYFCVKRSENKKMAEIAQFLHENDL